MVTLKVLNLIWVHRRGSLRTSVLYVLPATVSGFYYLRIIILYKYIMCVFLIPSGMYPNPRGHSLEQNRIYEKSRQCVNEVIKTCKFRSLYQTIRILSNVYRLCPLIGHTRTHARTHAPTHARTHAPTHAHTSVVDSAPVFWTPVCHIRPAFIIDFILVITDRVQNGTTWNPHSRPYIMAGW